MPSNKNRLYVCLYARGGTVKMPGGEDKYHWALLVGPKNEVDNGKGFRYHAKEQILAAGRSEWLFEEKESSLLATGMQLVRILVGKIENMDRLVGVLRKIPIRQGQEEWNCVSWVREALEALGADGKSLGTSMIEWRIVRDEAMLYVEKKKVQHRFDGTGNFNMKYTATYDLLEGKETVA